MGYIYKITNTINGKAYIGISVYEPEKRRIKDHLSGRGSRLIANAVKKYGKDAFAYEILEEKVFDEFLPDLEVAYIANYNTIAPNGYNLTSGGDKHKKLSDETRLKLSELNKGKKHSAEHRRKNSESHKGEKNHFFGKTHSEEARQKVSMANKSRVHSEEFCRNISKRLTGRIVSKETRRKVSKALMHPDQIPARRVFFSLPADMPLKTKRKLLYIKFPDIKHNTMRKWIRKWIQSN